MGRPSVEDRFAIADLFSEYAAALDAGDVEGVVACFAWDGWLDSPIVGRHQGRAELLDFAEKTAQAVRRGARFRHVVSNLRIETDGDRGRARCYLLDFVTMEGETKLLSPGEYDCELVRSGGRWLFQSRVVRMDRSFAIP
jgi:uncharacterized protein (TIGR02246 family)